MKNITKEKANQIVGIAFFVVAIIFIANMTSLFVQGQLNAFFTLCLGAIYVSLAREVYLLVRCKIYAEKMFRYVKDDFKYLSTLHRKARNCKPENLQKYADAMKKMSDLIIDVGNEVSEFKFLTQKQLDQVDAILAKTNDIAEKTKLLITK